MRLPFTVLFALLLTAAYWPLRWIFDPDPATQPLSLPYSLVRSLERDATLRCAFFGEQSQVRRLPAAFADGFETERSVESVARVSTPLRVGRAARALKPVVPIRRNPKDQYTKEKISAPSAIASRSVTEPKLPIIAVSARPSRGTAELARISGQALLAIPL